MKSFLFVIQAITIIITLRLFRKDQPYWWVGILVFIIVSVIQYYFIKIGVGESKAVNLERLAKLKKSGAITEEEFSVEKQKILSK